IKRFTPPNPPDSDTAWVEFVARIRLAGRGHRLHERRRFLRKDGRWWYIDGEIVVLRPTHGNAGSCGIWVIRMLRMLGRSSLANGKFLDIFRDVPGLTLWDEERLEASMREAIAQRPPGHAVWLFAYGSLIWNPLFHFVESCPGTLDGWRRSFCMRLIAGR